MLVVFKMSAVHNVVTFELSPQGLGRDAGYIGIFCHCFEILCRLLLQGGNILGNRDSMFL